MPGSVSLARRLLRRREDAFFVEHPDEFGKYVVTALNRYLDRLRNFYLVINTRLYENCDMVVDGTKPVDELVSEVVKQIRARAFS